MQTIDQYITQAILDDRRYVQGGQRVVQTSLQMAGATSGVATAVASVTAAMATAYAAGITFFGILAKDSLEAYAGIEAMQKGLQSVAGSATEAAKRMKELRDLAKAPGLGFAESVGAFTKLTGSGASPEFAERLIKEAANANARVGGGREEFSRILLALSQALTKRNFEGQDARQLADANIPIYAILAKKFGTGDTGELANRGITSSQVLNALVEEWSQLERVTGGLRNSFENLQDNFQQALASFGSGLADTAENGLNDFNKEIETLTGSGVFRMLGTDLANSIQSVMMVLGGDGNASIRGISIELVGAFTYARTSLQLFTETMITSADRMADVFKIAKEPLKQLMNAAIPGSGAALDIMGAGGGFFGAIHKTAKDESDKAMESAQNLLKAYEMSRGFTTGANIGNATAPPSPDEPIGTKNAARLERIAHATEKMASIFDKSAFGGSELLRRGITVFEATGGGLGGGNRRSANSDVELGNLIDARINRALAKHRQSM